MTWKHLPNGHTDLESYLFSLAQEGGCSEPSISSAGAQSDTSNGTTTASGSSKPESAMVCSTMPRYGMTLKPSMVRPGAGLLMSLRQDFPASRSVSPESSKRATTFATDGPTPFALLEKFNRPGSFWRMYQASLLPLMGISAPYSESWPKAGTMCGGVCYLQPKWERRISEIGSGLWRTPQASDQGLRGGGNLPKNGGAVHLHNYLLMHGVDRLLFPQIYDYMMGFPLNWTSLQQLEMPKFRKWLQQHGDYLPQIGGAE